MCRMGDKPLIGINKMACGRRLIRLAALPLKRQKRGVARRPFLKTRNPFSPASDAPLQLSTVYMRPYAAPPGTSAYKTRRNRLRYPPTGADPAPSGFGAPLRLTALNNTLVFPTRLRRTPASPPLLHSPFAAPPGAVAFRPVHPSLRRLVRHPVPMHPCIAIPRQLTAT